MRAYESRSREVLPVSISRADALLSSPKKPSLVYVYDVQYTHTVSHGLRLFSVCNRQTLEYRVYALL